MFDYDATGIEPSTQGQAELLPKGWYAFEVMDFVTNDGREYPMEGYTSVKRYPKVDFLAQVIDHAEKNGERIFHTVTFMPKESKGAGMAIHFLKTIGEPHEGTVQIESGNWVGKKFMGYVIIDEYQGKKKNKISEIKLYEPKADGVPF